MNNLAETLRDQGDLAGARGLQEQVLDLSRRVLGPEHPDTLTSMNNLALTLQAQGDLAGARGLQEQVLDLSRRVLGAEHPDTLRSMSNLAGTLQAQGDLAGARGLQEQVLDLSRRVLGAEHPDTSVSAFNLLHTLLEADEPELRAMCSSSTSRGCWSATRPRWAPISARSASGSWRTMASIARAAPNEPGIRIPHVDHSRSTPEPPMPDPTQKKPALLIPVRADAGDLAAAEKPLPAVLQAASRGAGGGPDPFLANVVVEESYTLAAVGRGEAPARAGSRTTASSWRWRPRTAPPSSCAATGCRRSWRGSTRKR